MNMSFAGDEYEHLNAHIYHLQFSDFEGEVAEKDTWVEDCEVKCCSFKYADHQLSQVYSVF
jgi:hypothetical protein